MVIQAAKSITAMICVTIIQIALIAYLGVDGVIASTTTAIIAGLGGYAIGKKEQESQPN